MMDDDCDDKDDSKRKSRNLSEKKRRDQFNMLINELSSMVSNTSRKMDKSTVLKSTISFLRNHNELSVRSRGHEIQEDWKPSFLSNEEFTHIILESVDGFIIVFSPSGQIMYASGSITSLLGHLPSDLMNGPTTMFDLVFDEDHQTLYDILATYRNGDYGKENQLQFSVHFRRGSLDLTSEPVFDLVNFVGYFRGYSDSGDTDNAVSSTNIQGSDIDSCVVFVGTGRLDTPHLISEMTFTCESLKSEFTSRHNLDWKFLALDARATPIIGYVQLEVVGTSGYDYYHVDDLDKLVSCHEALMEKGEGTSCYYRFLTKGQQWVWLQTRYYISYHQWNSKPEFVVCTHRVISYVDVLIQARKLNRDCEETNDDLSDPGPYAVIHQRAGSLSSRNTERSISSKSSKDGSNKSSVDHQPLISLLSVDASRSPRRYRSESVASSRRTPGTDQSRYASSGGSRSYQEPASDSTSLSEDSFASKSPHLNVGVRSIRSHGSSRQQHHHHHHHPGNRSPQSPAQTAPVYREPPQYVTAIPLQPIITGFPVGAIPPQELMRQPPSPLSDQLKRKQQELDQLRQLMSQKEEELQQFVMAQTRYGLIPSLLNVSVPYSVPGSVVSSTTQPSLTILPPVSSMPAARAYQPTASSSDNQQGMQTHSTESHPLSYHYAPQPTPPQLVFQQSSVPQNPISTHPVHSSQPKLQHLGQHNPPHRTDPPTSQP